MIASLRGQLLGADNRSAIIDVHGVGYRVILSTQTLAAINNKEGEISVLTSMIVREDNVSLYGFLSEGEQRLFEKLITVSGIGPKVALSALSSFASEALQRIIVEEDVSSLATVPGIGKKSAQRIILELRGVLGAVDVSESGDASMNISAFAQVSEALLNMGFTAEEIRLVLVGYEKSIAAAGGIPANTSAADTSAMLRYCLKNLGAS